MQVTASHLQKIPYGFRQTHRSRDSSDAGHLICLSSTMDGLRWREDIIACCNLDISSNTSRPSRRVVSTSRADARANLHRHCTHVLAISCKKRPVNRTHIANMVDGMEVSGAARAPPHLTFAAPTTEYFQSTAILGTTTARSKLFGRCGRKVLDHAPPLAPPSARTAYIVVISLLQCPPALPRAHAPTNPAHVRAPRPPIPSLPSPELALQPPLLPRSACSLPIPATPFAWLATRVRAVLSSAVFSPSTPPPLQ